MTSRAAETLDERGSLCPQPIIALGRATRRLPPGEVVALLADDVAAESDVPAWCRLTGAELLGAEDVDAARRYLIRLPSR